MNGIEHESAVIPEHPLEQGGSVFANLLLEWIDCPLILAEAGVVVDANSRACDLCGWTREAFAGLTLGASIDLLYQNSRGAEVEVYRLTVEEKPCQVAVMRLPATPVPALLNQGFDSYWIVGPDGNFVEVSGTYAVLTGYGAEELRTMNIQEVDRHTASRIAGARSSGFDHFEARQTIRDSPQLADLDVTLSVLPHTGGHVLGCIRDLTKIKRAEAELARAKRSLSMVGQCIRLTQTAKTRAELLSGVCESMVNTGGHAMAWVAIADPDGSDRVRVEASFGTSLEYLHDHQIAIEDTALAGIGADRVAMCSDFQSAEFTPWRERAIRYGFASSLSLQIRAEGRPEAALMIYAGQPDAFDEDAVRVLAQVADALEIGLEVLRKRSMQKAMEQNAHAWDENFREAFENSLHGMLVYDLEGKILDANAEFCNRLGYTRQDLVGAGLDRIVAPEYVRVAGERLEAIRNDGFAVFDTGHVCRDGSIHRVELSCRTYAYGEDQIVLAIARDLTQPVTESGKSLHLALQASQTGLFDWDLRTHKVTFSSEWKSQLGYKDHEITDDFAEWELRVHPDDQERMVHGLKAWLGHPGDPYEAEFRMRHKSGAYRWILARGAILYSESGEPERMLGSHVDVTGQKRAHQQASNAQRLESIGRLAGGVAQDFNQLLTVINGYSDLMLPELYEGDPLKEKLRAIREAGERAAGLTKRLLEFSPRQPAALRSVDLNTIVSGAEDTLRRLIGNEIKLVTQLCPDGACLSADPGQLSQLVVSLALNAREAMPKGGQLRIGIETARTLPPHLEAGRPTGPYIRLTVSDTGIGMDEETQLRVFDPFFEKKEGSSAQDLSFVAGIIKQHAGVVAVSSDSGKGTIFDVYFPAAAPDRHKTPRGGKVSWRRTAAILIVEEDAALRKLAAEILTRARYRVLEAANPREALLIHQDPDAPVDLRTIQLEKSFTAESLLRQVARTRVPRTEPRPPEND